MLEYQNFSFQYPNAPAYALKNINLKIPAASITLLLGPSGSGKTTLLQHTKPQFQPGGNSNGAIYIHNKRMKEFSPAQTAAMIGFVRQNPDEQIVTNSVLHELAFGLENLGIPTQKISILIAEAVHYFGLQKIMDKEIQHLSGGEKQILNLASTMIMKPELLLLDEPTSQLDPIMTDLFIQLLLKINEELGTTILMCEHHVESLFHKANQIAYLNAGQLLFCEPPQKAAEKMQNFKQTEYLPSALKITLPLSSYLTEAQKKSLPLTQKEGKQFLSSIIKSPVFKQIYDPPIKTSTLVTLKNCCFSYHKKEVIQNMTASFDKEQITAIVGGNGSGKTTLLRLIAEKYPCFQGSIKWNHHPKIALLPQNPATLFTYTSVEKELPSEKWLSFFQLEKFKTHHPYDLSGGQQQLLAIGKVLQIHPNVLLLDEPTKGLDPYAKKKLGEVLQSLKKSGVTIILVSHDLSFCAKYAQKTAVLFNGQIIASDTTRKILTDHHFYTTSAAKISRLIFKNTILECEVTALCKQNLKMYG